MSAALQGAVGFGLGFVALPVLIALDVRFVPGPMLVAALTLHFLVLRRDRSAVDPSGLSWMLSGRLLGTWPAALLLASMPVDGMKLLIAGLLLAGGIMGALQRSPHPTPPALMIAGAVSGFMATVAGLGGPAVALVYQHSPGRRLRGTLAAYFIVGTIVSLLALAWAGRFGREEIALSLFLIPGTVIGYLVSRRGAAFLDAGHTRTAVLAVSALGALTVLATMLV